MGDSSFDIVAKRDETNPWTIFEDPERRIEVTVPVNWVRHKTNGVLLDLHAPDDAWTVFLITSHSTPGLRFGEVVNELIVEDEKRWAIQRKASVIHNSCGAIESDFSLSSNGASWLMRKTFLPIGDEVFAFSFMTRLATWPRYGAIYRDVYRSFGPASLGHRRSRLPQSAPKPVQRSASEERLLII